MKPARPFRLVRPTSPIEPMALRLWPDTLDYGARNRAEWLRAVAVVRSTRRGWLLDRKQVRT